MITRPLVPNVICYNKYHASTSFPGICSSKMTVMIELCITQGTLGLHTLRGYKSIWSALSIPKRLLYFLGIPLSRLSNTTTIMYNFNAGSSHPLVKIHLRCQMGDLKSEVTCLSSTLTRLTISCLDGLGSTPTGLYLPHSTNVSSIWMIRQ